MAYEKRGLRPFDALDRTQAKLRQMVRVQSPPIPDGFQPPLGLLGVTLVGVSKGSIAAHGGTLLLDRDEYMSAPVGLYFGVNDDDWLDLTNTVGYELDEVFGSRSTAPVNVVVTVANARLKQVHQVINLSFNDWVNESWRHRLAKGGDNKNRPRPLRMPDDGCTIWVQFLLNSDLPRSQRVLGRPWRKGSWLARAEVRVSAGRGTGLAPRPLNSETRARFGLGKYTSTFVEMRGDLSGLCMTTDLSQFLTVYIDDELLHGAAEMNDRGDHVRGAGAALIGRWVMDTYRALIYGYSRDDQLDDFDPAIDEHKQTYLYSLLSQIEDANLVGIDEALLILRDNPTQFAGLIEHVLAMKASDQSLLELRR